jgi:hypothetical protein
VPAELAQVPAELAQVVWLVQVQVLVPVLVPVPGLSEGPE